MIAKKKPVAAPRRRGIDLRVRRLEHVVGELAPRVLRDIAPLVGRAEDRLWNVERDVARILRFLRQVKRAVPS